MNNKIPNFNLLAVFAAVIEQGSLSKAADHLSTNQSTISTALKRLKEEVGQELFIRSGRGVVPTAYATSLYEHIQVPVKQLSGVFQSLGEFDPKTSVRQFVVTAPEHLQWALLDQFDNQKNKHLTLEVYDQPDREEQVYDDLLVQKFDAMIENIPSENANTANERLFDNEFVIVCRRQHPRIQGAITEAQYMAEKHAVLDRVRKQQVSLSHYTTIDLSGRKVAYNGRSLFSNLLLCSESNCLTVVPLSMALQFEKKLDLQLLKLPFHYSLMSTYLVSLKKVLNDPAHQWLCSEIRKTIDKVEANSRHRF